jgi:hypothetical protein
MKRKIEISSTTRTAIVAALIQYGEIALGNYINKLYEQAGPDGLGNHGSHCACADGPEVWILGANQVSL